MNTTESRELHHLRTDQLAAESFLASEHEAPKEKPEPMDEPFVKCYVCRDNPCMPMAAVCEDCWD